MTPLLDELRLLISAEGPISVERYMRLCLQHPAHGYYTTRDGIGRDFTTAPEVSQMFGELLGLWAADRWLAMGSPAAIRLVELGPGRGTLMADALRAVRSVPGLRDAIRVDLVETSPRLRAMQRERLEGAGVPLAWHDAVDAVPAGPLIVLANEFFDALPIRQYVRGRGGWHERLVGLRDETLAFGVSAEPVPGLAERTDAAKPGDVLEVNHDAIAAVGLLAGRIARDGGALLACDYGHGESGFGETLQAVSRSGFVDPLDGPGEADLTAHVDFAALARAARAAGADAHGPVAQGRFLLALGIENRSDALRRRADAAQGIAVTEAFLRLVSGTMGTVFKAFAMVPRGAPAPPGFEMEPP